MEPDFEPLSSKIIVFGDAIALGIVYDSSQSLNCYSHVHLMYFFAFHSVRAACQCKIGTVTNRHVTSRLKGDHLW